MASSSNDFKRGDFFNSQNDLDKQTISEAQARINYNMTLPSDSQPRNIPLPQSSPQFLRTDKINGISGAGDGIQRAFFDKFTGNSPENVIQIREELSKDDGDTINIPLLMPLTGSGVEGDEWLEGKKKLTCATVCAKLIALNIQLHAETIGYDGA